MGHGLNSQDMIFINSSPPLYNNNNYYKNETGSFNSPINSISRLISHHWVKFKDPFFIRHSLIY